MTTTKSGVSAKTLQCLLGFGSYQTAGAEPGMRGR
jgi:hypothetical protein